MARGILAELHRAAKAAARDAERAQRESIRRHSAAVREAERRRKAEERAIAQWERAQEKERKQLEKEAKAAHVARMEAEAEERNLALAEAYEEIDGILEATLDVDDYVDLESLRTLVQHPPFHRPDLEKPTPPPSLAPDPPEPTLRNPKPPTGLGKLIGKKKHEKAIELAKRKYEEALAQRKSEMSKNRADYKAAQNKHAAMESKRLALLERERARYEQECYAREVKGQEQNKELDTFIANLGYGDADAVQEYVAIVLSNSVYPPHFEVAHEFEFDPSTAELRLRVLVPSPDQLPTVKAYKYNKSKDELTSTSLSQKACKDRYAGAVNQVVLRSIHELFEADRRAIIKTISLEVGTNTTDPATGLMAFKLFVATGAEREAFMQIDLSNVVPSATLEHLGASVSKNPYGLVDVKASGVRRS